MARQVDAEAHVVIFQRSNCGTGDFRNPFGKGAPVGVAKNKPSGASGGRREQCLDRIIRVGGVAIEEMLGIINQFRMTAEELRAFPDHGKILF